MFRIALIFVVAAICAAILANSGLAHGSSHIGNYLALVCLILAIGSLLLERRSRRGRPPT